ncbi:MAG: hypothetical protein A4E55_01201 [Pelotomaculum sp. PtaU1.Bin035]|nr:MAG: hypothetical protein A4E55_01201 [Pelotomaculum sp. PtaU1.Bin035]
MSVIVGGLSGTDVVGRTYYFKKNYLGKIVTASTSDTWYCTDVYGYNETMNILGFTTQDKRHVFCHEIGHALSLDHVDSTIYSIMHEADILPVSPVSYDEDNLVYKWGS